MTNRDGRRYWPFEPDSSGRLPPIEPEHQSFLETAYRAGFTSWLMSGSSFGGEHASRRGYLLWRGGRGRNWEVWLNEAGERCWVRWVDGFDTASAVVLRWLHGLPLDEAVLPAQGRIIRGPEAPKRERPTVE